MSRPRKQTVDRKRDVLRRQGVLNPRAEQVRDPLFQNHGSFDPLDLVQVKYEMVRRMEADHLSITDAAEAFGFSRPSFYKVRSMPRYEHFRSVALGNAAKVAIGDADAGWEVPGRSGQRASLCPMRDK